MNQQSTDAEVIVLGPGLGGLIAAALLVKKGHRVLLLKERGYQPSYRREGYQFIPFSNFSERRPKPGLLRRLFQELDFVFSGENGEDTLLGKRKVRTTREKVPFQVILPKARIDLFDDPSNLQKEWRREFPDELFRIEALYHEFGELERLLISRGKKGASPFFPIADPSVIRKALAFLFPPRMESSERFSSFSPEFNEMIRLQVTAWGSFYSDSFPLPLIVHLLLDKEWGEWVSQTDLEGMEERVLDSFLQSGGDVEEIEKVQGIDKKWRKGFTLTLEGDRRVFRSRSLVLNAPLHSLSGLLEKGRKSLSRWQEKVQPRYVLLPFFLGIREKTVPVGMRDLLVSMFDLQKPYEGGNVLFLGLSPKGDETVAPEGRRALTVQSLVPFSSLKSWTQASFASHQESVMKHLSRLIPFLEQFLEFVDVDWAYEQVRHWSYPHFLYETPGGFNWREGLVPNCLSRDLYLVGKENFPYLGLEGEVLGGLRVAKKILEKVER